MRAHLMTLVVAAVATVVLSSAVPSVVLRAPAPVVAAPVPPPAPAQLQAGPVETRVEATLLSTMPLEGAFDVTVQGDTAFVPLSTTIASGTAVLNVHDPYRPILQGTLRDQVFTQIVGPRGYRLRPQQGFEIFDLTDPLRPTLLSTLPITGTSRLTVGGASAYVLKTGCYAGLGGYPVYTEPESCLALQVHVSDPLSPTVVARRPLNTYGIREWRTIGDSLVYHYNWESSKGSYTSVLLTYSTTLQANPRELLRFVDTGNPNDWLLDGTYGYVDFVRCYWENGISCKSYLTAYDIPQATHSSLPVTGPLTHFSHTGPLLYALQHEGYPPWPLPVAHTLQIVDLRDSLHPAPLFSYTIPGNLLAYQVVGSRAYLIDSQIGLTVVQFRPQTVATLLPSGSVISATFDGTRYAVPTGSVTATATLTHTVVPVTEIPSLSSLYLPTNPNPLAPDVGIQSLRAFAVTTTVPLTQPLSITVPYTLTELGGVRPATLALYRWDESHERWIKEVTSTVDEETFTLNAHLTHLGLFAVLGEARHMLLPVALR